MGSLFSLKGKVSIVTGGANGIGASISSVFAELGSVVHILDIDEDGGSRKVQELKADDQEVYFHHCDVSNHEQVSATFQKVMNISGQLNCLINNAGVACIGSVLNTTPEEMDRLYTLNVKSVYSCLFHGIPFLQASGGGSIVNMASIASVIGLKDRFAYSMSKGAVYSMTFSIARDYKDDNIRCNAIGPARVHTDLVDGYIKKHYPGQESEMFEKLAKSQPIGRMGKPREIAGLAAYLCSDEAAFVTGSYYPIDGGFLTING